MAGVTYTRQGQTGLIEVQAGNASRADVRRELNHALVQYKKDTDAWMAVISSARDDFWGGTQQEAAPTSTRERRERASLWGGGTVEVWKPIIGAIEGRCSGEGLAVALACDMRVGDSTTAFVANLDEAGDEPDVVMPWLVNLLGLSTTFQMRWLGTTFDAQEALRIGLVNRIAVQGPLKEKPPEEGRLPMVPFDTTITVPDGKARTAAMLLAEEILTTAPVTRNFQKELAVRSIGVPFFYAQTLELGPNPYASEDRIEGTRAFVENRRPVWKNR